MGRSYLWYIRGLPSRLLVEGSSWTPKGLSHRRTFYRDPFEEPPEKKTRTDELIYYLPTTHFRNFNRRTSRTSTSALKYREIYLRQDMPKHSSHWNAPDSDRTRKMMLLMLTTMIRSMSLILIVITTMAAPKVEFEACSGSA